MELQKNNFLLTRVIESGAHEVPADGDIIVPDVKPDILKILQISGNCIILRKDISAGKATIDGRIDFTILYVSDTDNQNVTSISSYFDFSHSITDEKINNECYFDLNADLTRIDFQLINSRKLRIKSISELSYEIGHINSEEICVDTDGNDNPEVLKKNVRFMNILTKKQCDFTTHERIELPQGHSQIFELLRTDIRIIDKEYKSISGRIVTKGTFDVHVLYTDTDERLRFCDYQIPFTEIFEVEDTTDDTFCEIDYTLGDISTRISEDSDGDLKCIDIEILTFLNITTSEEKEIEYIWDCYCPGCETKLEKNEKNIDSLCVRTQTQQTIRDILTITPTAPPMQGIYNVPAKISISKTRVLADKTTVEGSLICFVIYTSESKENPICSIKKEIPFSVTIDTPSSREYMTCDIRPEISHIGYSINSAGEAEIRAIITIGVRISDHTKLIFIENAELTPLSNNDRKGIVLYFVQPKDTLWNIAKHYHVLREDILTLNKLDENSTLTPGMKLVIPMS